MAQHGVVAGRPAQPRLANGIFQIHSVFVRCQDGVRLPNASRSVRSVIVSLGPPVAASALARPAAALGRFWYPRPPVWPAAVSAGLHVAVLAALVWTVGDVTAKRATSAESVFFIPPPQQAETRAAHGGNASDIAMVRLSYFQGPGAANGAAATPVARQLGRHPVTPLGQGDLSARTTTDTSAAADNVYTSFEVDNVVEISAGSVVPQYPPDLLARGVQGQVTVRFVVDTSGSADVESIEIVDASDPRFAESVRAALPHMRFSPARLNGRRVRQKVEQPFRFNVDSAVPASTDSGG